MSDIVDLTQADRAEILKLCAIDSSFFAKIFFPKTARQAAPDFHRDIDQALDDPTKRYVSIEVFRGGAKTTKLRVFVAKRISFAISHTILFVSNSQAHSAKSLEWLKRAVEFNTPWAQFFGLRKGTKWTNEEIEIWNDVDEFPIRVLALGITGQVRGINVDDYRPDLIVCDDVDNEETTATPEQRKKTSDLFFGALEKSLAPASEAPHAKQVFLQTPLNPFDLAATCRNDPQWHSLVFGCFTETGESRWPSRFSTAELMEMKAAHIKRNQLALWMREMECKIVSDETASFRSEWLKTWTLIPEDATRIIAIDPASSDSPTADDVALVVLAFYKSDVYVEETFAEQGTMPDALVNELFRMILRFNPLRIVCETVAYQKILAWYIRREMTARRIFVTVEEFRDRRRKADRIVQSMVHIASNGHLWCRPDQIKFVQQFIEFSPRYVGHDDVLDAASIGITAYRRFSGMDAERSVYEGEFRQVEDLPPLGNWRNAP